MSHIFSINSMSADSPSSMASSSSYATDSEKEKTASVAENVLSPMNFSESDLIDKETDFPYGSPTFFSPFNSPKFDLSDKETDFPYASPTFFSMDSFLKETFASPLAPPFFTSDAEKSPKLEIEIPPFCQALPLLESMKQSPQDSQSLERQTIKESICKRQSSTLQTFIAEGISSTSAYKRITAQVALEILNERSEIIKQEDKRNPILRKFLQNYPQSTLETLINQKNSTSLRYERILGKIAHEILNKRAQIPEEKSNGAKDWIEELSFLRLQKNEQSQIAEQDSDEKNQLLTKFLRNYPQSTLQKLISQKNSSSLTYKEVHKKIAHEILHERAQITEQNTGTVKDWIEQCLHKCDRSTLQARVKQGLYSPSEFERVNAEIALEILDRIDKQDPQPHKENQAACRRYRKRKKEIEKDDGSEQKKAKIDIKYAENSLTNT